MEILTSFPKNLQILIIISPVVVGIVLLGLVLHSGYKKLTTQAWFWLFTTVLLIILYIKGLLDGTLSDRIRFHGIFTIIASFQTYRMLKK